MRFGIIVFLVLFIIFNLNNSPYPRVVPAADSSVLFSTISKPFGIPKNLLAPKMISNDSTTDLILKLEISKKRLSIFTTVLVVPVWTVISQFILWNSDFKVSVLAPVWPVTSLYYILTLDLQLSVYKQCQYGLYPEGGQS